MTSQEDIDYGVPYGLPEARMEEIFQRVIVPDLLLRSNPVPQQHPELVLLGGQPGSGKSTLAPQLQREFDGRGGMVWVNTNEFRPFHPDYERLVAEQPADMPDVTRPALLWWREHAVEYLRSERFNALLEIGFRDPPWAAATAERFADTGYDVHVVALAVPAVLSRLAIIERFARQSETTGTGRWSTAAAHEAHFNGTVEVLRFAEASPAVSRISLWTRDGPVYDNHRDPAGGWTNPPSAVEVLTEARDTPLNRLQCVALTNRLSGTLERLERAGQAHPALHYMAAEVQQDLRAAAADLSRDLSDPELAIRPPAPSGSDLGLEL
jgi:UDP-N-acetylglucosamine kinase